MLVIKKHPLDYTLPASRMCNMGGQIARLIAGLPCVGLHIVVMDKSQLVMPLTAM